VTDEPDFDELDPADHRSEDDGSEDEFWEPLQLEPEAATRNSPYAIAALVAGVLSALPLIQGYVNVGAYFPAFEPLDTKAIIRIIAGVLPAFAIAAAAYWLAGRADEEIYVSEGRLGGVGFVRAARVTAAIAVVGLVGLTTLNMTLREDPAEFNSNPEVFEVPDDSSGVESDVPPPPAAPAVPVP
jgi:hypothetical protein